MQKVLITGGTGLIGSHLVSMLKKQGREVAILSRKKDGQNNVFTWDPVRHEMDPLALQGTDTIINLAGASIAGGRWTKKYKKLIADSRIQSTRLLYDTLKDNPSGVRTVVSASAIGYYGDAKDAWVTENSSPGTGFLCEACEEWESAARKIEELGIRVVILRTGLVLAKEDGLLPVMAAPVKWGLAAALGNGNQYMSWIHIRDLCRIYLKVSADPKMHGVYNATAPNPVTNSEFMKTLAKTLHRPMWLPAVPGWALKIALGEKGELIIQGQRVSSEKIAGEGFDFEFRELDAALKDQLK